MNNPQYNVSMVLTIRIKEIRESKGLTQQELADLVGVSKPHISGVERGIKNLNNHLLEKISSALEVLPYELLVPPSHDRLISLAASLEQLEGDQLNQGIKYVEFLSQKEAAEQT